MASLGYRPTLDTVEQTLGGTWENTNTQSISNSNNSTVSNNAANDDSNTRQAANFAEGDDKTTQVDDFTDQLADEIAPIAEDWIEKIKTLLDDADSLEALRDELNTLASKLSFEEYVRVFEAANITAKLAGIQRQSA